MEVRIISGNDEILERQDFYDFQISTKTIRPDFCHKDMTTGEQAIFFCVVCDCELKSVIPLKAHVEGQKHIRKAIAYKQRTYGNEPDPVNQPKKIKPAAPKVRVDVNQSLTQRLREYDGPILGLEKITEIVHPNDRQAPPFYTCGQDGCKSAWGNSDDMFNHVKGHKHIRNCLRVKYHDDPRVNSQNKNELIKKANEVCLESNTLLAPDREYDLITLCSDKQMYKELETRPMDWSEKKVQRQGQGKGASTLGLGSANANLTPLGYKDRGLFNETKWKDFKAPTLSETINDLTDSLKPELDQIKKMIEDDVEEKILLMQIDLNLEMLEIDLVGDLERPEYKNLLKEYDMFKRELLALKERVLKKFKPVTSAQQRSLDRAKYTDIFKNNAKALVLEIAESTLKGKAALDIQDIVIKIVDEKIMKTQIDNFLKKDKDWKEFVLDNKTKTRVETFARVYLLKKYELKN